MNLSKTLVEKIYETVKSDIEAGKNQGEIPLYKLAFYLDKKPTIEILQFPLSLLIADRTETVYIGGQLES